MVRRTSSVLLVMTLLTSLMATTAGAQTTVFCGGMPATIVGTPGADVLEGTPGVDVIAGLQGNDYIFGAGGDDYLCGGIGDDFILGGLGFDVIFGAQGDDEIYAGGANEQFYAPGSLNDSRGSRIFAGAGDDLVYGSIRWDRMQGGPGNDTLYGFAGNDWMRGGPGRDLVVGHKGKDDLHGGSGSDLVLAERNDSSVRAGAGADFCPNLPGTANWRGCVNPVAVATDDSTLPAQPIPAELAGGDATWYVYLGFDAQSNVVVVGAHQNLSVALGEQQLSSLREVTVTPVLPGQALAIVEAFLLDQFPNVDQVPAIDPAASYYADALAWGRLWSGVNGWS